MTSAHQLPGQAAPDERSLPLALVVEQVGPPSPAPPTSLREAACAHRELRSQLTHDAASRPAGRSGPRERIAALLDPGSFVELDAYVRHRTSGLGMTERRPTGDGLVAGTGTVDGRPVAVFAHDRNVFAGAMGEVSCGTVHKLIDLAESVGMPVVGLNEGAGARIQEGVTALAAVGGIFLRNVRASGVIPQISVVLGACAGGSAYSPALTDVVIMAESASMFVTGPDVVAAASGERVSAEALGGSSVHAARTGLATLVEADEPSCMEAVRLVLSYLPAHNQESPPVYRTSDPRDRRCEALYDLVPADPSRSYDIRRVIAEVADHGDYLELHERWAPNIVCALTRLDGHSVGLVANQPCIRAGALDIDAAEKAARFVRMCDAFQIPLVTLVDVPGFVPGSEQEHGGILRRGAKLLYAYCEATVPRVQVVLRKAYGGAYITMDSKSLGADLSFAWPVNEIAVMGAEAAAKIVFRKQLQEAADDQNAVRALVEEYRRRLLHPYAAVEQGLVDDVIDPAETREVLIRSLELLRSKRVVLPARKHGNGPM
jgi:acetyl-CoA carboxylase carboxyltransferase component